MKETDLQALADGPFLGRGGKPRAAKQPRGYAAPPGTGPADETCKTCKHLVRKSMAKTYLKCGQNRSNWTGGGATDVKASAPACRFWEARE